jgi:Ca2+-binding RTX toxin-like protein
MEGGNGNDTYKVDNANDLVIETGAGLDTVVASVSYVLRAGVTVETLTTDNDAGTAAINLTGNELANRVVGNAANNTLHGGAGNDRLEGLDGADTLWGDAGQDLLIGGNGNDLYVMTDTLDTTIETATGGNDRVSLSLSGGGVFTLGNYIETLVVAGTATEAHGNSQANTIVNSGTGNSLYGEGGNDTMSGGAAAEAFLGGAGNDRITAGAGDDTLWGDAGNDVFVFATGSGADEVGDFTHAADKIDLSGWGVTSFSEVQGMMSQSGANTFIDLGGGHSITLDNVTSTTLDANDFLYASAIHSAAVFSVEEASDAMMRSAMLPLGECRCTGGPATFSMLADI